MGSRIIEELQARYKYDIISAAVLPADDVVTAPYNAVCALASLARASNLVLPFDNQVILAELEELKKVKKVA